jgi:hypothetical protein
MAIFCSFLAWWSARRESCRENEGDVTERYEVKSLCSGELQFLNGCLVRRSHLESR